MSRPTILVVDDDPSNRDILVQELTVQGYRTVEARNGREAIEKAARDRPDLILLDVMMPIMDGFEACRLLKSDDAMRLVPVVIMTALHAVNDRITGIEAGADEFLTKPVDAGELEARIRTALKAKRAMEDRIHRVEQIRDHYAKFVPDLVRRLVAENPEAPELDKREQDAAFVFVDICGYTALSQRMAADALSRLVERYFSAFLDSIQQFDGEISGTAGDGLLAIFHRADPIRHSRMAAETAFSLLAATGRLNAAGATQPSLSTWGSAPASRPSAPPASRDSAGYGGSIPRRDSWPISSHDSPTLPRKPRSSSARRQPDACPESITRFL